jgi:hypothetical protein
LNVAPQRLGSIELAVSHDADVARARYLEAANHDPRLSAAAAALVENNVPEQD